MLLNKIFNKLKQGKRMIENFLYNKTKNYSKNNKLIMHTKKKIILYNKEYRLKKYENSVIPYTNIEGYLIKKNNCLEKNKIWERYIIDMDTSKKIKIYKFNNKSCGNIGIESKYYDEINEETIDMEHYYVSQGFENELELERYIENKILKYTYKNINNSSIPSNTVINRIILTKYKINP